MVGPDKIGMEYIAKNKNNIIISNYQINYFYTF